MPKQLTRRQLSRLGVTRLGNRFDLGQHLANALERHAAVPPDDRRIDGEVDDRGLEADVGGPGIENEIHATVEIGQHVLGRRRTWP